MSNTLKKYAETHAMTETEKSNYFGSEAEDRCLAAIDERIEELEKKNALIDYAEANTMSDAEKKEYFSSEAEDKRFEAIDERIAELEKGDVSIPKSDILPVYDCYSYKGHVGRITFDVERGIFTGDLFIREDVTYEGKTKEEAIKEFYRAVDELEAK